MTHYHLRKVGRVDQLKSQKIECPASESSKPLLLRLHAQLKVFSKQADKYVAGLILQIDNYFKKLYQFGSCPLSEWITPIVNKACIRVDLSLGSGKHFV